MDGASKPDPRARAPRRVHLLLAAGLAAAALSSSCVKAVDLKQVLEMVEVNGGWFDAGIVGGRNKIVPNVSFRLKKRTPVEIDRVSVNALFRAADGRESELDNDVFVQRVEFRDSETQPITIRAENGYTAEPPQSRADMLKHSQFRDIRVQILVKQGSSQWTDLGWIDVKRHLITQ
jgi:hypothetical protein